MFGTVHSSANTTKLGRAVLRSSAQFPRSSSSFAQFQQFCAVLRSFCGAEQGYTKGTLSIANTVLTRGIST
eukprot:4286275-Prymnesium_polylepis.1